MSREGVIAEIPDTVVGAGDRAEAADPIRLEKSLRAIPMAISAQARTALFLISAGAVLFASAGTFAIAVFWVYLAILAAIVIVSFLMLDPELLHERMRPGGKPLPLGVMLATAVFAMHWVVAGLDVGRFHWSDTIPRSLQVAGFVIFVAANALAFWAMHVNRFFSSIVRIQSDRGQYVVTAGPYAFVRHPGYAAGVLVVLASGIALGSWFAAAFVIATNLPFILHRLIVEDRVLRADLAGYADYARRVRWRLLPGVW
jgi:protein-S-isoprenylcysteine O-methyltransferase Ste14